MKKRVFVIYVIFILLIIKLLFIFFTNENFISKYNNGIYNENQVKKLFFFNFVESYIAYYNHGNVLYKNSDFDGAINDYKKALKRFPPEEKECSIRINLCLAMLAKIDDNSSKDEKIKELNDAKEKLCEKNCDEHNAEAMQLREDIENMIEQLQNDNNKDKKDDKNQKQEDDKKEQSQEDKIKEQLKKVEIEARSYRNDDLDYIETTETYDYHYNGKRW